MNKNERDINSKNPISELLVKIEIDSNEWVRLDARGKLRLLVGALRQNSEKLVTAAGGFVDMLSELIRANTSNPVVNAYLGLVETGFGLMRATTLVNNLFISAKHDVHTPYDALAKFMGLPGGNVMISDSMDATASICETFLALSEQEQEKYGIRFIKVHRDEDDHCDDSTHSSMYHIDTELKYKGSTYHVGFELAFSSGKRRGDRIGEESYAFITFGMPVGHYSMDLLFAMPAIIYGIYVDHIDISKNLIRIKYGNLYVEPRPVIDFDVKNFDLYDEDGTPIRTMESETAFIRNVLDKNGRRGYIVQGDQGTGKTISVNRLLMNFPDVPVFWISPDSISDRRGMGNVFRVLNMFPGSFFVFDDFDGNDMATKNEKTGAFIDYIDETISPKYRGITILIINEPQKLHSTIKLRPGRIDDIIYVKNPDTVERVSDVVEQAFKHLDSPKPDWVSTGNEEFCAACEMIFESHLSHAYIAGVVTDMVRYSRDEITVGKFRELVSRRISTIKYARMVARDDGHLVDGPPPSIPKLPEEKPINSPVQVEVMPPPVVGM